MDIIMIPFHDYKKWTNEGYRTRDAHLFQYFEKDDRIGRILVVNRPVSIAEMLIKRKVWNIKSDSVQKKYNCTQLAQVGKKSYCLDFLVPDLFKVLLQKKSWWFTAFNYEDVINAIKEAAGFLVMKDPVLLLQNPMAIGVAQKLKYRYFVFDAIDNWLYHPQMKNKELIRNNYRYVEENADLITTVSEDLTILFQKNKNVQWIPNGVEIDFFRNAINYTSNKKIRIGYIGKIQERVDFELIEKCLQVYPEMEFVFAGPILSCRQKTKELASHYPNIKFCGDIPYQDIPQQMKSFDIGIIPHRVDEFTQSMNPLKLYEYLAAGKAVVTTGVAGTKNVSSYVFRAESEEEFIDLVGKISKRIFDAKDVVGSVPERNTWQYISDAFIDKILALNN